MNIGFDLDGVLMPDYSNQGILEEYLKSRVLHFKPLFNLDKLKDYFDNVFIVTGRPNIDLKDTEKWVSTHFKNVKLFHNDGIIEDANKFKEKIIKEKINIFIESDKKQVNYLKENTNAKIIHFEDFMLKCIKGAISE